MKTIQIKLLCRMMLGSSLMLNSSFVIASDIEIYQAGAQDGSVALMLMMDQTQKMKAVLGKLNDGFEDYSSACVQVATDPKVTIEINGISFQAPYCRYTKTANFFQGLGDLLTERIGHYKGYRQYIQETCEYKGEWGEEYRCFDRLSKAKIALISLMVGNSEKGISPLSNDKVVGLSSFSSFHQSTDKNPYAGKINVPARRLDALVVDPVSKKTMTQRLLIANTIARAAEDDSGWDILQTDKNSPIATAYAETAAALMGTTTKGTGLKVVGRKDSFGLDYFYECKKNSYNEAGLCDYPLIRTESSSLFSKRTKENLQEWINSTYHPDGAFTRTDYPFGSTDADDPGKFLETKFYYVNDSSKDLAIYDGVIFKKFLKYSGFSYADSSAVSGDIYIRPALIQSQMNKLNTTLDTRQCHAQGIYVLTAGTPELTNTNGDSYSTAFAVDRVMKRTLAQNGQQFDTAFSCDTNSKLNNWIYDASLGLIQRNALWPCISNYSDRLKSANNPTNLSIRTAVTGVGRDFAYVKNTTSYDLTNAIQLNSYITNVNSTMFSKQFLEIPDRQKQHDVKNAAKWGAYGGGGFYSALSVQEIVDSVNNFVNVLAKDIPSATASQMTLPVDALNTFELQDAAYSSEFQPTVSKAYPTWFGNIKKYKVVEGIIKDKYNAAIFENNGLIKSTSTDFWSTSSTSSNTGIEPIFQGGVLNKQLLKANSEGNSARKIYINRTCKLNGTDVACGVANQLKMVDKAYFSADLYKNDPLRGYFVPLLGYNMSTPENPDDIDFDNIELAPELRQLGSVLHSTPVLMTQKGKIDISGNAVSSSSRDDFLLFGTTQGLLHVVDASTGAEKLIFVPNEMLESNQRKTFVDKTLTSGGAEQYLYGIDAPWTAYTEYVPTGSDGYLTVGKGKLAYTTGAATDHYAYGKQWVYGGLRMGGRSYYALDLADLDKPKMKFQIDPENQQIINEEGVKSVAALQYMGQSWSKPVIARVNWEGESKLVMFVGGGYDATGNVSCANTLSNNRGYECNEYDQTNQQGAGVYMFDADNGNLLWWTSANATTKNTGAKEQATQNADLKYSVVSSIKTVDRDGDGLTDHLYFGDLGGQVWRIDINNQKTAGTDSSFAQHIVRVMNLHTSEGKSPRFYQTPIFSIFKDAQAGIIATLNVASGNLSRPLQEEDNSSTWQNDAIYTVFDKDVAKTNLYDLTTAQLTSQNLAQSQFVLLTDDIRASKSGVTAPVASNHGWYYPFSSSSKRSAKVISDMVSLNKQLFVPVYDASKNGTVQGCDAGIKGETIIQRFCMPYGQCSTDVSKNQLYAGVGIVGVQLGSKGTGTNNTRQLLNTACQGDACTTPDSSNQVKNSNVLTRKFRPIRWFEY